MGRIISIASQKGGVGKTTTVLNLGYSLSRLGLRVLMVDVDPQGGLGFATNLKKKAKGGLVDVLRGRLPSDDAITVTRDGLLAVVGVGSPQPEDVLFLEQQAHAGAVGRLVASLARGFDYTLIDAPGGIGGLVHALFLASDSVLAAINGKALAVRSLPAFLKMFHGVGAAAARPVRFEGLVVTMFDPKNAAEKGLCDRLRDTLPPQTLFKTMIPLDPRFEQASFSAVPVAMLPGAGEAARAYMDLALELRARETPGMAGEDDGERVAGLF